MLGQRMIKEGGATSDGRLRFGFRLVTGHFPSPSEQAILSGSLQFHRSYFDGKPKEAAEYLRQGEVPRDPKLDPVELAAYASVASLLMNLDEAITKE